MIVTGVLSDLSDKTTEVLARAIRVDSGAVLSVASAIIDRIWSDNPRLPHIAQPRSAMPIAFINNDENTLSNNEKIPLTSNPFEKKLSPYYPAAVPALTSNILQLPKERLKK